MSRKIIGNKYDFCKGDVLKTGHLFIFFNQLSKIWTV